MGKILLYLCAGIGVLAIIGFVFSFLLYLILPALVIVGIAVAIKLAMGRSGRKSIAGLSKAESKLLRDLGKK